MARSVWSSSTWAAILTSGRPSPESSQPNYTQELESATLGGAILKIECDALTELWDGLTRLLDATDAAGRALSREQEG
jgi:hypothetical protein